MDRYRQIRPRFLFSDTEVTYSGKQINLIDKIREVVQDLSGHGLQQAILLPSRTTGKEVELKNLRNRQAILVSPSYKPPLTIHVCVA